LPVKLWEGACAADAGSVKPYDRDIFGISYIKTWKQAAKQRFPVIAPDESEFRKMSVHLDDSVRYSLGNRKGVLSIRPFALGDAELEKFELLTRAIRESAIQFLYRKHGQLNTLTKRVHPYHIAYVNNQWTLFANDPKEKEVVRKFVLFRLTRPELTEERFTVSKDFDLGKELEGSLGVFKENQDYEILVEFDAWGADDVRAMLWHSSQEFTELPKGRLRVKMRLNSLEEIERWVLGFGDHATVLEPQSLRERLKKTGESIHARYSDG